MDGRSSSRRGSRGRGSSKQTNHRISLIDRLCTFPLTFLCMLQVHISEGVNAMYPYEGVIFSMFLYDMLMDKAVVFNIFLSIPASFLQ